MLERLRRDPATTVVATDFDGTLSAIVDDPAAARPVDGAVDALAALATRYAAVAVLSGRPVAFLQRWLPPAVELRGLYGLEAVSGGVQLDHAAAGAWRAVVDEAAAAADIEGVHVEHKGLSLTLHFRTDPTAAAAAAAWAEAAAERTGLALRPARMSIELHPPVAVDKGTALAELVGSTGATAACFIGDDAGDLPAFTALDRLGLATAVRIAVRSPEAPPALLARADLIVDGPDAVVELLASL